jgi:hypothetical protein
MHRIVTGWDAQGRSVFAEDAPLELAPSTVPGNQMARVWGTDAGFVLPTDGREPPSSGIIPPPTGFRAVVTDIGPTHAPPRGEIRPSADAGALGVSGHVDDDGLHWTESIDVAIVLSGEVYCVLDGGAERRLSPGDVIVQNGTRHAWENRSGEPCRMFFALVGATVEAS